MGKLGAILDRLDTWTGARAPQRQPVRSSTFPLMPFQDYVNWVTSGTGRFPVGSLAFNQEGMSSDFIGYVSGAYASNGIVFACELARFSLFSEARFQFRRRVNGVPGEMFGSSALAPLENPTPGQTTGDLLARMLVHADFGGNAFPVRTQVGIRCLRPDWTTMVLGSRGDPVTTPADVDAELIGLVYTPGGRNSGNKPIVYKPGEFAHFAPIPDPTVSYSGMPWIMPIIREVMADQATTTLKLKFFENGATPNLVVTFDPTVQQSEYDAWVDAFEAKNKGAANAWKTVYLGGGTTLTPVGKDFQQIDYKAVQGAGETRIAAAAGVPPVIAGFSEGLAAATYSNYGQARRRFADLTMRPLWRNAAGSLARLIEVPAGAELWYDDRDIPFLQEDMKDEAVIVQTQSMAIRTLVDGGYTPDSAKAAVISGNLDLLAHTGLYSVQLQPPGTDTTPPDPARSLAAMLAPYLAARSVERPQEDEPTRIEVHTHQPEVERLLAGFGEFMRSTEERAQRAEERASEAIEASARALEAIADRQAPTVNVTVPEQAAPVVNVTTPEVRVDVPMQPAPVVNVTTPATQDIRIVEMPPANASIQRGADGKASSIKVK